VNKKKDLTIPVELSKKEHNGNASLTLRKTSSSVVWEIE